MRKHSNGSVPGAERLSEELRRAIRICGMGTRSRPAGLFSAFLDGKAASHRRWDAWLATDFHPRIAGVLVEVHTAAGATKWDELLAIDRNLTGHLSPDAIRVSGEAGRNLLASLRGARHVRVADKLRSAVEGDEATGHFPVVFSLQAAAFNVPLNAMLAAYLFYEWLGGLPDDPDARHDERSSLPPLNDEVRRAQALHEGSQSLSACA